MHVSSIIIIDTQSVQSNTSFPWELKPYYWRTYNAGQVYLPQGPDSMAVVVVHCFVYCRHLTQIM